MCATADRRMCPSNGDRSREVNDELCRFELEKDWKPIMENKVVDEDAVLCERVLMLERKMKQLEEIVGGLERGISALNHRTVGMITLD